MKRTFSTELAYLLGIVILALGTAFMERASFGMSMVVAPAYIIYLKLSQYFPFFTFGMAEYCLQAVLIIALALALRQFHKRYLFSFVTAVFYGFVLDGLMSLVAYIPGHSIPVRIVFFISGMLLCSSGVSLLFHTYIAPEAYELFVKEISATTGRNINKVKTAYDCTSCLSAVALSFLFFGFGVFMGVNIGTVITALCNGFIIGRFSKLFEKTFEFRDSFALRKYFE